MLIFTSDHGEMLGSHGLLFKGAALYEELVKIPLLIRPPGGLAAPHRTEQLVSHVDLVPTIVQWCGGAAPVDTHGVDIQGLSRGEDTSSRAGLALEYHSSNWASDQTHCADGERNSGSMSKAWMAARSCTT